MKVISCKPSDAFFENFFPHLSSNLKILAPFLSRGLVVVENEVCTGRICLYDVPDIHLNGDSVLALGDCWWQDNKVGYELLKAAADEAFKLQKQFLIGPLNGTTWNDYRLPLNGNAPMFTTDSVYPPWYKDVFLDADFKIIHQYHSYISKIPTTASNEDLLLRKLADDGKIIRPINTSQLQDDLALLYPICNAAFAANPLFTAITEEEFIIRYQSLPAFMSPDLTFLATDEQGLLLAFMLCLHDKVDATGQTIIMKTIAKNPAINTPGLMTRMGELVYARASKLGYKKIIHAFMHEGNKSMEKSTAFGGQLLRSYGLFAKKFF